MNDTTDPYAHLTPEELEEFLAWVDERCLAALEYQMDADAPYETPPWGPA